MRYQGSQPRRHLPTSPFAPPSTELVQEFTAGDRVMHDAHGLGRVIEVEESGGVSVDFGTVRERFVPPYSRLSKL